MHSTLSRSTHPDQLVIELRDACCSQPASCPSCQARAREVRAARRDAIIHSISTRRPRRFTS